MMDDVIKDMVPISEISPSYFCSLVIESQEREGVMDYRTMTWRMMMVMTSSLIMMMGRWESHDYY